MLGDMVTIKSEIVEQFRKDQVLSRSGLFDKFSVHADTGRKILSYKPVRISVVRKVALVMGVDVKELIQSWSD